MAHKEEDSMRDKIIDCLRQQINEFELLKSMYPNDDEIVLIDSKILNNIQEFIENKSEYTPNHLDFVVNLIISGLKMEICVNLPSFYPFEEPDIYVRCNQLNRKQETMLNNALSNYIKDNFSEEVCLYTAISWLQDNTDLFNCINTSTQNDCPKDEIKHTEIEKFVRYWIYSHHIYNKKKRDEILKRAKDLQLTGFCLPGKPGIICIEGPSSHCKEWWSDIKSMNWKKIVVRATETFDISEQPNHQKFSKFEELVFKNTGSRNNKHADMSGFSKFMEERGLGQAFNDFFGLEGDC